MATEGQFLTKAPGAGLRCGLPVALAVTAVANTDFSFQLPAGARNVKFNTKTVTAFGAATDAQLQLGNAAGGAQYVAAVSIKAAGEVSHALVAGNIADLDLVPGTPGTMTTFYGRIVQSGAASATGAATLNAEYTMPV